MHPSSFLTVALATLASAAAVNTTPSTSAVIPFTDAILLPSDTTLATRDGVIQKRGCFSGGVEWGVWKGRALQLVVDICTTTGTNRAYGVNINRTWCINLGDGLRANFGIWNFSPGTQTLAQANCIDKLSREINGCGHGGETSYEKFRFT